MFRKTEIKRCKDHQLKNPAKSVGLLTKTVNDWLTLKFENVIQMQFQSGHGTSNDSSVCQTGTTIKNSA